MTASTQPRIRLERPGDIAAIHAVNSAAFDTPFEADLVDRLRQVADPFVSYVATVDDDLVGHILFTPVVVANQARELSGVGLAPMAVLPEHQRSGIGSLLVEAGLEACRSAEHGFAVVLGHPEFYPRFGFQRASTWGLSYEQPVPDEAMMALELRPGALDHAGGVIRYHSEFSAGH